MLVNVRPALLIWHWLCQRNRTYEQTLQQVSRVEARLKFGRADVQATCAYCQNPPRNIPSPSSVHSPEESHNKRTTSLKHQSCIIALVRIQQYRVYIVHWECCNSGYDGCCWLTVRFLQRGRWLVEGVGGVICGLGPCICHANSHPG
jgi:hypothetical protein